MNGQDRTSDTLANQIESGDLHAVEDAWLSRLAEQPDDVAFFAGTARELAKAGKEEQATFLLQILDEQLQEEGRWSARLSLLREVGMLVTADPVALHSEIVRTLEAAHPGHSALRGMAEKVGLFRAIEDLPKLWGKVDRLLELVRFDRGTVVWLEGKGPGRVVEANLQLASFRVALADGSVLGVGFAAATKILQPLPPEHVMHRALEDPETLRRLAREDAPELLRLALESYTEPLTAKELREALHPIVPEEEWAGFWNRARKHPQLLVLTGSRQRYRWAESALDAVASLRERFAAAALEERLDLLRRHGDREPGLRAFMVETLIRMAQEGPPEESYQVAVALERTGASDEVGATTPEALLDLQEDPLGFVFSLSDRSVREDALRRLVNIREDWPQLYERAMLRETDPRLLDRLAAGLRQADRERLESVTRDLLANPRRNPAGFVWLAERAAEDEGLQRLDPLRLFQQILQGIGDAAFGTARRRLAALVESGGTLPRLLPLLGPDQANSAEDALSRTAGLEEYQRTPLRNALHLRFPELRQGEESPLYATPEAIAAKRDELRDLLEKELPANRRAIEVAREMGDLRENFEYKSARQRHEYLSARATALHRDLARARPVETAAVDRSAVRVGTRVLLAGTGGHRSFTILGPWDSRPEEGVLSNEADLAQELLGKAVGDEVEIDGQRLKVTAIEPYR